MTEAAFSPQESLRQRLSKPRGPLRRFGVPAAIAALAILAALGVVAERRMEGLLALAAEASQRFEKADQAHPFNPAAPAAVFDAKHWGTALAMRAEINAAMPPALRRELTALASGEKAGHWELTGRLLALEDEMKVLFQKTEELPQERGMSFAEYRWRLGLMALQELDANQGGKTSAHTAALDRAAKVMNAAAGANRTAEISSSKALRAKLQEIYLKSSETSIPATAKDAFFATSDSAEALLDWAVIATYWAHPAQVSEESGLAGAFRAQKLAVDKLRKEQVKP